MIGWLNGAWNGLLDAVYPRRCGACSQISDAALCEDCRDEIEELEGVWTLLGSDMDHLRVAMAWRYSGRAGQAVRRLKYERMTRLGGEFARDLAAFIEILKLSPDTQFIPVPIHRLRTYERGFNQSELLCEHLPPDRVHLDWLKRIRATRQQVGLDYESRRKNLEGAFEATYDVDGQVICLIDDVCTTGSTLFHCAQALKARGARTVFAVTLTGKPDPSDRWA